MATTPAQTLIEELASAKKKIERLQSLVEATKELNSTLDLDQLLNNIMDLATREMQADRSTLYLYDRQSGILKSRIAQGLDSIEIRLPVGKGIAGTVAATGEIINIADAYADPRFNPDSDRRTGYLTKTVLCLPMRNRSEEIIGVLQVLNKNEGIFTREDEEYLLALAAQAAIAVENAQLHKELLEKQRIEEELAVARRIQQRLLPAEVPTLRGFDIAVSADSCYAVGGDYYDFIALGPSRYGLAIADVAGKGIPAALLVSTLHASLHILTRKESDPSEITAELNRIVQKSTDIGSYATFFWSVIDTEQNLLRYSNAGHLPPLILRNGTTPVELNTGGMVIGIFAGARYEQAEIELRPNDIVLFYTDGITETKNKKDEEYAPERMVQVALDNRNKSAEEIRRAIIDDVRSFAEDLPPHDDTTLIVLKVADS